MDLLKTLLIYMSLVSVLAVQEGPLPQDVPTPTPLPPHVTATLVPFQTEAPTPSPTLTPPPIPTITANMRYTTLRYQDRSNDVRKLQRKLIELGYMPEGSADGAYGYQTYNAVRDFQAMNGLEADGVAGPATLTNLYENPAVLPYSSPTPRPTSTPTPTLPPVPTLTAAPGETPAPAPTAEPGHEVTAIALTELPEALIIYGVTGEALAQTAIVDGVSVRVRPDLWVNATGDAVVDLMQLADCMEGWFLSGSSADGFYTLSAAGYVVEIQCSANGASVTVDGNAVAVGAEDVQLYGGVLYVTDNFFEKTLAATTVFDADEQSLVLFIQDKRVTQSAD